MEPSTLGSTISTSTGLSLVNAVRYSTSLPSTLVDGLDALLHGSSTPLHRGDVVEIQGVTASGKSQLLYKLAINHLLPRKVHVRLERHVVQVNVGGKEQLVAWFDCTPAKLDLGRIANVLKFHLVHAINQYRRPKGIGAPTEQELDSLVKECLTRLHVFSPTSTLQLACTVQGLPEWYYALATPLGGGGAEELGCVVIDGMTEFAWLDQYEREQETRNSTSSSVPPPPPPLKLFSSSISHLRQTLSPLIFISQWVLRPHHPQSNPSLEKFPVYRPHFTPPLYPSLTNPPATATSRDSDPLNTTYYYPPSTSSATTPATGIESFPIHFHMTLHPSPRPIFRKGVSLQLVLQERARGQSTEGIVCVLREKGGKELGSWEMEIGENEIIA